MSNARWLTLIVVVLAVAVLGVVSRQKAAVFVIEDDLRDAVACPVPTTLVMPGGRALLISAAVPETRRADLDDALLSLRRRRARRVSAQ